MTFLCDMVDMDMVDMDVAEIEVNRVADMSYSNLVGELVTGFG